MSDTKRVRVRAIIIYDSKIMSMYRERDTRVFYTFPGGGLEGNETEQECVKREVLEEFGINVEAIKKLYTYENEISIEHFYLCKYIDGSFGTGTGEEFQEGRNNGLYEPTFIRIKDIPNLPLMPPEVATSFYEDYTKNGETVRDDVKVIQGALK